MRKILVLGAGYVAGPLVRYFLDRPGFEVSVADLLKEKAEALVGTHPRGRALGLRLEDDAALARAVSGADIVVSLVPNTYHPRVAKICISCRKNMVTTSYASEAIMALDCDAQQAGIIILNEVGLDPGIDHMEALRVVQAIKKRGEKVLSFISNCGGLPAPEANTNPFGYKFSWSPRGVLLAGKNAARYLMNGSVVQVPAGELFDHYSYVSIKDLGRFESYPNRDSLAYLDLYGIPEAKTMLRATLRYPGWCETLRKIGDLGLLGEIERDFEGRTYSEFLGELLGVPLGGDIRRALAAKLKLSSDSPIINRLEWLGLLSSQPIPKNQRTVLDMLESLMVEKLGYARGERDMIVLQHELIAEEAGGSRKKWTSLLIEFGRPGGDTAMSRTVGLPAAVASRLVLEEKISWRGVCLPVFSEIFEPILDELGALGIVFRESAGNCA
jgi:saccharopine dehydrogenase (NADP+, L-glutamate forming)